LHGRLKALPCCIGYSAQADSTDALFRLLRRNNHQSLVRRSTTPFPRAFPSNEDFVHLDRARKPITSWTDHGAPKLVQPLPRSVIAAETQDPLQAQRTHTVFLTGYVPHGFKPKAQRLVRVVQQRPRCRRNLVATLDAPELSSLHRPSLDRLASWANKPVRPSHLRD